MTKRKTLTLKIGEPYPDVVLKYPKGMTPEEVVALFKEKLEAGSKEFEAEYCYHGDTGERP